MSRLGVICWLAIAMSPAVRAADSGPGRGRFTEEDRVYLAPGVQFGLRSQEISTTVGIATVAKGTHLSDPVPFEDSVTFGARVSLVNTDWSPAAVHGLLFLSRSGWVGFSWPQGFEVAGGYGGGNGRGYGIGQLTYLIGIASRFELNATWQGTVGSSSPRPPWFSTWLFGVRYGFDLGRPRPRSIAVEPQGR